MAFTEFYCQSGGSNLNSGSTNSNTAAYTSTNGNWSTTTNVFTPTDGSTPASSINVGDWVSIYIDGATTGVFVARVTAVAAGVNGGITVHASFRAGTPPTTNATARSLKAGGAWKGPNGTDLVPFNFGSLQQLQDANSNWPRINLKNDQTYSITSGLSTTGTNIVFQGYSSTPGDGGRTTIDGGTSNIAILTVNSNTEHFIDFIFKNNASAGTSRIVYVGGVGCVFLRCTATGGRGSGFYSGNSGNVFIECESNNNNRSNTGGEAGFFISTSNIVLRCLASGNTGSLTDGFQIQASAGAVRVFNCIAFGNGRHGLTFSQSGPAEIAYISKCDFYNNAGDGIKNLATTASTVSIIENCNFIKNGGWGINSALTTGKWQGFILNCGFGSGTQVNTSGDTNGIDNVQVAGKVTYASGVTPWVDPTTGDFRVALASAIAAGRGNFTETQGSFAGTIGYPDIGGADALVSGGGESSYSFG